ncbi:MAG: sensor histidine kinase [Coriobacteriales bacterium]|nr:sensor histidine kinase [Coriobacteriales bacterium]
MRFIDFLRSKLLYFIIVLLSTSITVLLITSVFQIDPPFAILSVSVLVLGSLFALVPEYLVKRRYYRDLAELLTSLDKKFLLSALVEYPEFEEGRILCETITAMGKAMNDEIARFSASSLEYREYIEMWVHEIKTPIAGMKLMSENIHDRELLFELDRIDSLVEQVLFYARSNTVEKDYQIRRTPLDKVVNTVLKGSARQLIAKKIRVHTEELDYTVLTDVKWTTFILRQLVDNAVKYGATNLTFSAEEQVGSVALLVRDDGVGIEEKDLARIFDKGFTGENGRRFGRSTGLGLYLCRKLCEKMGLEIAARSVVGEGTVIEIVFPQRGPFS